jgi:hypothetical protein
VEVLHILDAKDPKPHKMTEGAVVSSEGKVLYPPA